MEKIVNGQLVQKFDYNILGMPRQLVAGIPAESLHIQNQQAQTPFTQANNATPHSLGSYSAGTFTANSIKGGIISGTSITIGGNFSVDDNGNADINNANIHGELTATGGNIAGWQLTSDTLVGSSGSYIQGGTISGSTIEGIIYNGGSINIGPDGTTGGYYFTVSDTGQLNIGGSNFQVTNQGVVTITGGSIAIGSDFAVTSSGALTTANITATGGSLGSLTVTGTLTGGTIDGATVSGGTVIGATVNLKGGASAFLTFDDSSGSPDASILEDGSNNLLIRAGSDQLIAFQSQGGGTNWVEMNSGGIDMMTNSISNISNVSSSGTVSTGTIQANSVNTNGQSWTLGDLVTGSIDTGSSGISTNSIDINGIGIDVSGGYDVITTPNNFLFNNNGQNNVAFQTTSTWGGNLGTSVGGTGSVPAAVMQVMNKGSSNVDWQFVISNSSNTAAVAIDAHGDIACFGALTVGANNTGQLLSVNGNASISGTLTVGGTAKTAIEVLDNDQEVAMFSMEAKEVLYFDRGVNKIIDGEYEIILDDTFSQITEDDLQVLVSANDRCGYLYAKVVDRTHIKVFSDQDIDFTWQVSNIRRDFDTLGYYPNRDRLKEHQSLRDVHHYINEKNSKHLPSIN
jgi:hypothetical protein